MVSLRPGMIKDRDDVIKELIDIQFERNDINFTRGTFRVRGDSLDIFLQMSLKTLLELSFLGMKLKE